MDREPPAARIRFDEWMPSRILRWSLYFLFWTMLGVLSAATAVIELARDAPTIPAWEPITWELSSYYTIGVICPFVVAIALRFPFSRRRWAPAALVHGGALVAFSLAHTGGMVGIREIVYALAGRDYDFSRGGLVPQMFYEFFKDIPLYWIIVFLTLGFEYYNRYRERQLDAAELRTSLVESRLSNLRGQLNPHFLFNTLSTISSVMYENVEAADTMIQRLGDLLRYSLRSSERPVVRLSEELESLDLYLEVMRGRFADSVDVVVDVEDAARDAMVPSFILQPLAENAFEHGLSQRTAAGKLELVGRLRNGTIEILVRDNGPGSTETEAVLKKRGVGLDNTSRRLEQLYGGTHRFELHNCADGGLEVRIAFPADWSKGGDHAADPNARRG